LNKRLQAELAAEKRAEEAISRAELAAEKRAAAKTVELVISVPSRSLRTSSESETFEIRKVTFYSQVQFDNFFRVCGAYPVELPSMSLPCKVSRKENLKFISDFEDLKPDGRFLVSNSSVGVRLENVENFIRARNKDFENLVIFLKSLSSLCHHCKLMPLGIFVQANTALKGMLSKTHADVRVILQSKAFTIDGDSFEVDGLIMASGEPYLVESKTALVADDVSQLVTTAVMVKKHCAKLDLKSEDVQKIQNSCVKKVLASPVARPEVMRAIRNSSEMLCLIVDSGSSFTIAHDGIGLKTGSDFQTKCLLPLNIN
jgi:hypothetical protein